MIQKDTLKYTKHMKKAKTVYFEIILKYVNCLFLYFDEFNNHRIKHQKNNKNYFDYAIDVFEI